MSASPTSAQVVLHFLIPSDPGRIAGAQDVIEHLLQQHGFDRRDCFAVRLALEAALLNAIQHGNQSSPLRRVLLACSCSELAFEALLRDEGIGFDPATVPDPLAPENLGRPCGRGLLLMRHYMDEVVFLPPGNTVWLRKNRSAPRRPGVLIVDDEDSVRATLSLWLKQDGYTIWTASDAREAVELFHRQGGQIDMLLLDVHLPELSGPHVLAAIRQINPTVPCCFMTGDAGAWGREGLLALGAAEVLDKPFNLLDVTRALQRRVG